MFRVPVYINCDLKIFFSIYHHFQISVVQLEYAKNESTLKGLLMKLIVNF